MRHFWFYETSLIKGDIFGDMRHLIFYETFSDGTKHNFQIPLVVEMYGSTEGTVGLINTQNKVGAIGFISRFVPFLPVTLIKLDKNGDPIRDAKTGLCVHCKPGEEGEVIGLVRPDDRGGPEKFQVYK